MQADRQHEIQISDFSETAYRSALRMAATKYSFTLFTDIGRPRTVLWRHDLDASVHRALALARIESEEGLVATYFVFLRCGYYNSLSQDVLEKLRQIIALGHGLGLHFDPSFYGNRVELTDYYKEIEFERDVLAHEIRVMPSAVSFHNFGALDSRKFGADVICQLVNAYGQTLRRDYDYVSDSNGVWRHRRLLDVLQTAEAERLQVLTHPEWWTPEIMTPRARLQRAIDGYSAAMGRWYDELTGRQGRPNF